MQLVGFCIRELQMTKDKLSRILKMYFPAVYNFLKSIRNAFCPKYWIYNFVKFIRQRPISKYHLSDLLFETDKTHGLNPWVFHDENWVRVIHCHEHGRMLADGLELKIVDNFQDFTEEVSFSEDGTINFIGKAETENEWLYLFLDPETFNWSNYSWQVRIRRDTYFREFQFAFRYQGFDNRYRYRFENDCIYFDKVINFKFYNGFGKVPFHMKLGVWYDIRIDVYENNFKCYVNEVLMMNDFDFSKNFSTGSIAIILWEDNGVTDIRAAVGQMSVRELIRQR